MLKLDVPKIDVKKQNDGNQQNGCALKVNVFPYIQIT